MADIQHVLRNSTFPMCAADALGITEQLIINQNNGNLAIPNSLEFARDIMSEFIFCERLDHGGYVSNLNNMQQLQLIEVFCKHFSNSANVNELLRITQFLMLFPSGDRIRSKLLVKLVSVAVATRCRSILLATGIWLQQFGVTATGSQMLAQGLVKDYFVLVPEAVKNLQDLPSTAPQFTANFLAAVAHFYSPADGFDRPPPSSLLKIITSWVSNMPSLCRAGLTTQQTLPLGGITMPPVTPIAGLFRWCILAPLRQPNDLETYSQLHFALMESVLDGSKSSGAVAAPHIGAIIPQLLELAKFADEQEVNRAVDKLLQAILVLLHSHSFYGNTQELFNQLGLLPHNPLLTCVKANFLHG